MSTTPVIFDDGSKAMVPPEKLSAALRDGGKVAQAMQFDDGSKAYVPLDRVHDAIHDGGQLIGAPPQPPMPAMQSEPMNLLQRRAAQTGANFQNSYEHLKPIAQQAANDVYDVSAPNIAEQVYRHVRGMPNTLKDLPPKMVLSFLSAGGLGEGEIGAEVAAEKEAPQAAEAAIPKRFSPPSQTPASVPAPAQGLPVQAPTAAPQAAESVDPLLQRLRKIASDIQQNEAEQAVKMAARRGRTKAPTEPSVPTSDADMLRLLKLSLSQAQERGAATQ